MLDLLYALVFLAALPWVVWRRAAGRRPVAAPWQRFTGGIPLLPPPRNRCRIWLHGVSVGEVALLTSLASELRQQAEAAGRNIECVI